LLQKEYIYLLKNKKILLATSNKGKIREFKKIFHDFELISQEELDIDDAVEDGLTFFENALKKARHASKHSDLFSIADDSGLVVPDLNYEPGIYSARYAGIGSTDEENRNKIISELKNRNEIELSAYYVCVIVGVRSYDDPIPVYSFGRINGKVSIHSSGDGGFGYDPIFHCPQSNKSAAQMQPEEKAKISHRGKALQEFEQKYRNQSTDNLVNTSGNSH